MFSFIALPLAFGLGFSAGLRAMLPLSVLSWAAVGGLLPVQGTWLEVLAYTYTPYILTVLAILEIVSDKLAFTPSRKTPPQFGTRIVSGIIGGTAIGLVYAFPATGLLLGALGAITGTLLGARARGWLAVYLKKDFPAAIFEDLITVILLGLIIIALSTPTLAS